MCPFSFRRCTSKSLCTPLVLGAVYRSDNHTITFIISPQGETEGFAKVPDKYGSPLDLSLESKAVHHLLKMQLNGLFLHCSKLGKVQVLFVISTHRAGPCLF